MCEAGGVQSVHNDIRRLGNKCTSSCKRNVLQDNDCLLGSNNLVTTPTFDLDIMPIDFECAWLR
jgi:hypothetical protein